MNMCAAVTNNDLSLCEEVYGQSDIETIYFQALCGTYVAAAMRDPKICDNFEKTIPGFDACSFQSGQFEIDCTLYVAAVSGDKSLCAKSHSKTGCEFDADMKGGKLTIDECEHIDCLYDFAGRYQDKNACEKTGKKYWNQGLQRFGGYA